MWNEEILAQIFLLPTLTLGANGASNTPTHSHGSGCKPAQVRDEKSVLICLDNPPLTSPEVTLSISHSHTRKCGARVSADRCRIFVTCLLMITLRTTAFYGGDDDGWGAGKHWLFFFVNVLIENKLSASNSSGFFMLLWTPLLALVL